MERICLVTLPRFSLEYLTILGPIAIKKSKNINTINIAEP